MTAKPHRRKTCVRQSYDKFLRFLGKYVDSEHGCDADWYSVLNSKPMANCSN